MSGMETRESRLLWLTASWQLGLQKLGTECFGETREGSAIGVQKGSLNARNMRVPKINPSSSSHCSSFKPCVPGLKADSQGNCWVQLFLSENRGTSSSEVGLVRSWDLAKWPLLPCPHSYIFCEWLSLNKVTTPPSCRLWSPWFMRRVCSCLSETSGRAEKLVQISFPSNIFLYLNPVKGREECSWQAHSLQHQEFRRKNNAAWIPSLAYPPW